MFVPLCWGEISPVNVKALYNDEIGRINKRLCPLIVCNIQTIDERQDKKWITSMQRAPSAPGGRGRSFTKAAQT
ncbi:hypothetical protein ACJ8BP_02100, partial [Klebsiella pneumoniae]